MLLLHPTGYTNTIQDLKDYVKEGSFPGRNQANLQLVQRMALIYQDPYAAGAGFMNGPHVDYTSNLASVSGGLFIGGTQGNLPREQPSEPVYQDLYVAGAEFMNGPHVDYTSNLASNSGTNIPGANVVDQMAVQHEGQYLDPHAGFTNGLHPDYTNSLASVIEGWFMGGSQANLPMDQPSEPICQGPSVAGAGFMNAPHVDYTSNLASNSGRNIPGANQMDQMAVQHEGQYLDPHAGFTNGLCADYTINNSEGCFMGGNQANLVMEQSSEQIYPDSSVSGTGFMNGPHVDYTNNLASNSGNSGYYPPAGTQMDIPSNTYPMNDDMSYMPSEISMFEQTSYSQPSIHSSASLDEPFDQLVFSENNSMPEPTAGEYSHADGASTQHYYCYNPY